LKSWALAAKAVGARFLIFGILLMDEFSDFLCILKDEKKASKSPCKEDEYFSISCIVKEEKKYRKYKRRQRQ